MWLDSLFFLSPRSNPPLLEGRLDFPKSSRSTLPSSRVGWTFGKAHMVQEILQKRSKWAENVAPSGYLALACDVTHGHNQLSIRASLFVLPPPPPVCLDPPHGTLDGLRYPRDPPTGGGWTLDFLRSPTDPLGGGGWTLDFSQSQIDPRNAWKPRENHL